MNIVFGILIDVVLLLIVFLCYKKGAKDGFAKTLVSLLGFAIAIVLAGSLCAPVSEFVYEKAIQPSVETAVSDVVNANLNNESSIVPTKQQISDTIDKTLEKLPAFIKDITGIEDKKDELMQTVSEHISANADEITQKICTVYIQPLVLKILSVIVFLLLFILIWLACKIIANALKIINKLPLLGKVNALLGGLIGVLRGVIFVLIVSWALVVIVKDGANLFGVISLETVESSIILKTIAQYNPLNLIISSLNA
ncbi:MAG: CvpA family protein [Ruminococcaceae bacterium]|nr:CvpA family protein [Oscillospiraceae bacterium]